AFYFFNKMLVRAALSFLLAVSFHFTVVVYFPLLVLLVMRREHVVAVILMLSLCYALGVSSFVFSSFESYISASDDLAYYAKYAGENGSYKAGVRLDFLAFSLVFWALALMVSK